MYWVKGLAVAADDLYMCASDRLACLNRLNEHVMPAVGGLLGQNAEIRNQHQA
jgi:hypothetical protein